MVKNSKSISLPVIFIIIVLVMMNLMYFLFLVREVGFTFNNAKASTECFNLNSLSIDDVTSALNEEYATNNSNVKSFRFSDALYEKFDLQTVTCMTLTGDRQSGDQTNVMRLATQASSRYEIPLMISGNVFLSDAIKLFSNTYIVGSDTVQNAQFISYQNQLSSMFIFEEGSERVKLENLTFREGTSVSTALVQMEGKNVDIAFLNLRFVGKNPEPSMRTRGIFLARSWAQDVYVKNSEFVDLEYGIHMFAPVTNLQVNNSSFERWAHYAILVNRSSRDQNYRTEDVLISRNKFKGAIVGGDRGVILVTRAPSRNYVKNVDVLSNVIEGNGGSFQPNVSNDAHGDQIVLHGVNEFRITNNTVTGGGENAITASRLSRNGLIANNQIYRNDGHGVSLGSGYYELVLDDVSGLSQGDIIQGNRSDVQAKISAIYEDTKTIGIDRVRGAVFQNERISNVTTGQSEVATVRAVDRTKRIKFIGNDIFDNGIDSANEVGSKGGVLSGVFVVNTDSIEFRRNQFYNTTENPTQNRSIHLTKSRNILIDTNNTFEGNLIDTESDPTLFMSNSWLQN